MNTTDNFPAGKSHIDEEFAFMNNQRKTSQSIDESCEGYPSNVQGICKANIEEEIAHFEAKSKNSKDATNATFDSGLKKYHHPGGKKGYY